MGRADKSSLRDLSCWSSFNNGSLSGCIRVLVSQVGISTSRWESFSSRSVEVRCAIKAAVKCGLGEQDFGEHRGVDIVFTCFFALGIGIG